MPSSITHSYFAIDIYKKMPSHCKAKLDNKLEYFKLFSQGSDPFMFYHFFIGKKAKSASSIQYMMHFEKTQEFFLKTIKFIHKNNLINESDVMSYLYGYICHYCLDLLTHPFIYYKGGKFCSDDKNTYKYNGLHQEIEYRIDSYLIEKKEKIDPRKFRIDKFIFNVDKFSKPLEGLVDYVMKDIYKVENGISLYYRSIWYMKKFFYLANYDPYGFKLKLYRLIDKISKDTMTRIDELSYYNTYIECSSYLNLEHNKWNYPWDKNKVFNSSFLDLYDNALKMALDIIEEVTIMLESKKLNEQRLKKIFNNLSFATGLDCNKKVEMKYFEF